MKSPTPLRSRTPLRALTTATLFALALPAPLAAAQFSFEGSLAPLPGPHRLGYESTTAGLEPPSFEGGQSEFEMEDVNGDGHVDLISVGDHGSPFIGTDQHGVMVWLGDGLGGFTVVMEGNLGYGGIAVGDVNGDGLCDVGYGVHHNYSSNDFGDQLLEVALGDGSGANWLPWDDGLATSGETWGMFGTDFGDVDADGDLDIGSNSFGCCAGVHVYRNHGDGTWSESFGFLGGNSATDFRFCDFDGNGHLDALAGNQTGLAWRGDGTGAFVAAHGNLPGGIPGGLGSGDVDGDGDDEIAFVVSGAVRVQDWTPGDVWVGLEQGLPKGAGPSFDDVRLWDMDVDGELDLVAFANGTWSVWGRAASTWSLKVAGVVPGSGTKNAEAFQVGGDLDHNGFPDMVVLQDESSAFSGTNKLKVLLETSNPRATFVRLAQPGPNRVWRAGQVRFVRWNSAVVGGALGLVNLELSVSGPGGPWSPLALGVPNDGTQQVLVPPGLSSTDCYLRAVWIDGATAVADVSDAAFTIAP